ncbi:unnamed protein product [Bursaphelenchus xylophilus]|uniref:(pine wood nematode) hypothetical protein n=1 Tax=Bursaphelenchus xylophilus TaxID=6326 RepID=A0A1I7ST00_BURXY|nr:unnamed protein product [Bursaphelenchus xylophilus]CAG9108822.1 unnamed protein product [Bursaphelenchus xylophilus]
MVRIEYGRFEDAVISTRRALKPRQEISAFLKWLCFLLNLIIFLIGLAILSLGIYSFIKDPRSVAGPEDILFNASIVLGILGIIIVIISLSGLFGALRENWTFLKISVWTGILWFVVFVIAVLGTFFIFYSDNSDNFYINTMLDYAVKRYHLNGNIADAMDYLQETMECCGIRSLAQGYRDWQLNEQFYCNETNIFPERCGVPFSCCKKAILAEGTAGNLNSASRSLNCWQNALKRRPHELEGDLYVRGCMVPLKQAFEKNAIIIASVVALIVIFGCLYVFMEYVLARQIEYQHYLLDREARRAQRRARREARERERRAKEQKGAAQGETEEAEVEDKKAKRRKESKETARKPSQASQKSPHTFGQQKIKDRGAQIRKKSKPSGPAVAPRVAEWVREQSDYMHKMKK